jgi:hypothetical protein
MFASDHQLEFDFFYRGQLAHVSNDSGLVMGDQPAEKLILDSIPLFDGNLRRTLRPSAAYAFEADELAYVEQVPPVLRHEVFAATTALLQAQSLEPIPYVFQLPGDGGKILPVFYRIQIFRIHRNRSRGP